MPQYAGAFYADVKFNMAGAERDLAAGLKGAGTKGADVLTKSLSDRLQQSGTQLTRAGRQMTFGFSAPLAAAAASAVDQFGRFDQSMTRIAALVQGNTAGIEAWGNEVSDVAVQYGQTAAEAGDALYFITSSGFAGADATKLLELSARGAAVGLGTMKTTADVLTSAVTTYGEETLTAGKAADILTVAVKEGKGEADQMGGALSRVIPFASQLGISFAEMAGSMASLTLSGTTADEAATQLSGLLSTLADMPPIAQRALKAYTGISYETLKLNLASKGFIPTLKEIDQAFAGNEIAMSEVFGNIRALRGQYGLFGEKMAQTEAIVARTAAAHGELNTAWDITAESKSFKLQKALAEVKDAMVEFGEQAIPVVTGVTGAFGSMLGVVSGAPDVIQKPLVGLTALAIAAGPATYAFGAMKTATGQVLGAVGKMSPTLAGLGDSMRLQAMYASDATKSSTLFGKSLVGSGGLASAAGAAGAALALGAVGATLLGDAADRSREQADNLGKVIDKALAQGGVKNAEKVIANTTREIQGLRDAAGEVSNYEFWHWDKRGQLDEMADTAERSRAEGEKLLNTAKEMATASGGSADALYDWLVQEKEAGRTYERSRDALHAYNVALSQNQDAAKKANDASAQQKNTLAGVIAASKETAELFFATTSAVEGYADAQDKIADAHEAVVDAERDVTDAIRAKATAQDRELAAARRSEDAARKLIEARKEQADAERVLRDLQKGLSPDEKLDVESAQLSLQEARKRLSTGKFEDPLDRRRAQLDVRRAELELQRAKAAHDKAITDAQSDLARATENVNSAEQAQIDARKAQEEARQAVLDADTAIGDAREKVRDATREVAQAEIDALTPALELAGANAALADALSNGSAQSGPFLEYLRQMRDLFPELREQIDLTIAKFEEADRNRTTNNGGEITYEQKAAAYAREFHRVTGRAIDPATVDQALVLRWWEQYARARAYGGPVTRGQGYGVNELGAPEMYTDGDKSWLLPVRSGRVLPLTAAESLPVKGGDGVHLHGDLVIQEQPRPRDPWTEARRGLRKMSHLAGY